MDLIEDHSGSVCHYFGVLKGQRGQAGSEHDAATNWMTSEEDSLGSASNQLIGKMLSAKKGDLATQFASLSATGSQFSLL